jgi:hypothetical protein
MVTVLSLLSVLAGLALVIVLPVPMVALTTRPTKTPRRNHQHCDNEAEAYAHDDGDNRSFVHALGIVRHGEGVLNWLSDDVSFFVGD